MVSVSRRIAARSRRRATALDETVVDGFLDQRRGSGRCTLALVETNSTRPSIALSRKASSWP